MAGNASLTTISACSLRMTGEPPEGHMMRQDLSTTIKNFATELTAAYNQNAENVFTSNYKPTGFINYKELLSITLIGNLQTRLIL